MNTYYLNVTMSCCHGLFFDWSVARFVLSHSQNVLKGEAPVYVFLGNVEQNKMHTWLSACGYWLVLCMSACPVSARTERMPILGYVDFNKANTFLLVSISFAWHVGQINQPMVMLFVHIHVEFLVFFRRRFIIYHSCAIDITGRNSHGCKDYSSYLLFLCYW